jgi:hypothetical protein
MGAGKHQGRPGKEVRLKFDPSRQRDKVKAAICHDGNHSLHPTRQ